MAIIEKLNLDEVDNDQWAKHFKYLTRPHSQLCIPPLAWKERFAYEALEWYNKNKAHDNFAHYKIMRTLMANKVHYEGEYYCHVNFVAIDTVCGFALYQFFFAEVKLSQDGQSNEVLACCILSPQAWTGCLSCSADLEILHPPPSEYNVGTPRMGNVSLGSLSAGVTEDTFKVYLTGRTPSMLKCAYPVGRIFVCPGYRDSVEGNEIRTCLEDHLKKTGEKYLYVKMTACESIIPDGSFWRHYNFLAKRADVSNAEMEFLFAEKRYDADPDAPVCVCCSLGPAKLVPVKMLSEFGGFYKVTTPGYRRENDSRHCFCSIKHPSDPDLYTMHRKGPRYNEVEEEDEIPATTETQTLPSPLVSETDQTQTPEGQKIHPSPSPCPSPVMQSNQRSSSSSSPSMLQSPEMSTSSDAEEPNVPEEVEPTGSAAKRRKVDDGEELSL